MAFTFNPSDEQYEKEEKSFQQALIGLYIFGGIVVIQGLIGNILVWQ